MSLTFLVAHYDAIKFTQNLSDKNNHRFSFKKYIKLSQTSKTLIFTIFSFQLFLRNISANIFFCDIKSWNLLATFSLPLVKFLSFIKSHRKTSFARELHHKRRADDY